jgi:hypothetical protein
MIAKIDGDRREGSEGAIQLIADIGITAATRTALELCKIDLAAVDPSIEAMLFFLDGGSRNFGMVCTSFVKKSHKKKLVSGGPSDFDLYELSSRLPSEVFLLPEPGDAEQRVFAFHICSLRAF